MSFFVFIWNIFQFFLGVITIIIFGVVSTIFHIVCFKYFFNVKNVCMSGFSSYINILFLERVVVSTTIKTKLDGHKDEPRAFYNLFLMLETDYVHIY